MMRRLLLLGYMIAAVGAAMAQGTPFLKNYSADEYQAQDINFDINVDKNGTVYAANFEGLLYYDNAIWRILYTSGYTGISRITVTYIDKNNVVWVGGYNYFGKVSHRPNGQLYLERVGGVDQVRGEVYEIWEKDDALRFLVSNGNICEKDAPRPARTSLNFRSIASTPSPRRSLSSRRKNSTSRYATRSKKSPPSRRTKLRPS